MLHSAGIDIAKHEHQLRALDAHGQSRLSRDERRVGAAQTIANTRAGFTACVNHLRGLSGTVQVALEATGSYWLALYEHLTRAGFTVYVCNPLQVHAHRQTGVRRTKTDRRDAF